MANIDSITGLERKVRRHFLKVFNKLNDSFFIREPLTDALKVAPVIIEASECQWLFIGWHEDTTSILSLQKLIVFNKELLNKGFKPIKYLAIIDDLPKDFLSLTRLPDYISIIGKSNFYLHGDKSIEESLTELTPDAHIYVKSKLFPESVIPNQITTRRTHNRINNSASLQHFFLDYDQELSTRLDIIESLDREEEEKEGYSVRLINGVAGSGKTLIIINRILALLKKNPEHNILLVIHNRPIVTDVRNRLSEWLGGIPSNLEIKTFHAFARGQKIALSGYIKPLFLDKDINPFKEIILSKDSPHYSKISLSAEQVWSELEYINDYMIDNKESYLTLERQGRGFALQRNQREHIWHIYESSVELMSRPQGYLPSLYIKELSLLSDPNDINKLKRYHHILVDEAQFFAPSWLNLITNSLLTNGSIFLCADPNQGFLKNRLSWKSIGLNVIGRTKKISYSYRTTYEIMVAANALLEELEDNPEDFIKPNLKKMSLGKKPYLIYTSSHQDEKTRFLNELECLINSESIPLHQIMVLCDKPYNPWHLKNDIEKKIGLGTVINYNDSKSVYTDTRNKIRLMNINSCTGMEAGITFVLGVGELMNEAKNANLTDSEKEIASQESLRKLYVAMTRAGQRLTLFSTEILPKSLDNHVITLGTTL